MEKDIIYVPIKNDTTGDFIEGKIRYNELFEKFQTSIDGKPGEDFNTLSEAKNFMENAGFSEIDVLPFGDGGQIETNLQKLEKGLDNPYISAEMKIKLNKKIAEIKAELEAKQNPPKLTIKDLEARLTITKMMVKKDPTLKPRMLVIEKMLAKAKTDQGKQKTDENSVNKLFSVNAHQIGKVKYSIKYYDGGTHKDGSPFIGISTYKSKKDLNAGSKKYVSEGFKEVNDVFNALHKDKPKMKQGGQTWIQEATKKMKKEGTEGLFTKNAKKHGLTPIEFAKEVLKNKSKYSANTRKQAQFVKNTNPEKFI